LRGSLALSPRDFSLAISLKKEEEEEEEEEEEREGKKRILAVECIAAIARMQRS